MTASWLEQLSGCGLFVKRKEKQISRFPLLCKECGFRVMTFKASIEYPQGNVQERVEYRNQGLEMGLFKRKLNHIGTGEKRQMGKA